MSKESRTRYPGLASFTTAQKNIFFGRRQEIRELFNLISVERTVVLFSKSGFGKTSLLQAGIMPLLYGQMLVPVPIRFGTDNFFPEQHFSIQFDTAWLKFQAKNELEIQKNARDSSESETFWEQISRCPFGSAPAQFTPLLIFDQFEELFTLYPDREHRKHFINALADLIHERIPETLQDKILTDLSTGKITDEEAVQLEKAPPMRFMFAIRSDMLHFMDELSEQIPYILRSRYQLFGLKEEQAADAIVAPAALLDDGFASQPFAYSSEALEQILAILTKNSEVESFQLQAVCQTLEEKIIWNSQQTQQKITLDKNESGLLLVTPEFYGGHDGIDDIIEDNYKRRIESLAQRNIDWPSDARHLLEKILVNKNNRRQSVDVIELNVSPALLDELERQRLVRKEPRLESFYYEISHDTWLLPIIKGKRATLQEAEFLKDLITLKSKMYIYVGLALLCIAMIFIIDFYANTAEKNRIEALFQKRLRLERDVKTSRDLVKVLKGSSVYNNALITKDSLERELKTTDSLIALIPSESNF